LTENGRGITRLKNLKLLPVIVVGLILLGLPLFGGEFLSYLVLTFFAYAVTVIGFNLLFGYAGLLSFGHALFMTVGAYTAAFLTGTFGLPYMELILAAAVIVSAILAALIGACGISKSISRC
jgi:branched-chain amino acid transport system permease protein